MRHTLNQLAKIHKHEAHILAILHEAHTEYLLYNIVRRYNAMKRIEDREEAARRQRESNRKAVQKYQNDKSRKRINCLMPIELYEQIVSTGQSANSFIIQAIEEKLANDNK